MPLKKGRPVARTALLSSHGIGGSALLAVLIVPIGLAALLALAIVLLLLLLAITLLILATLLLLLAVVVLIVHGGHPLMLMPGSTWGGERSPATRGSTQVAEFALI